MSLSSLGPATAQALILILPPFVLALAALKIRLAWHDRPFSRRTRPFHFWLELCSVLAFALAVFTLWFQVDLLSSSQSLLINATVFAIGSGQLALGEWRYPQPSKVEFPQVRESGGGSLIAGIILWLVATAIMILSYSWLLTDAL